MSVALKREKFSYADYRELPDTPRVELIEGEFFVSPAPNIDHQEISLEITYKLVGHVKRHGLGKVLEAPTDVVLSLHNVVQPDILFISKERYHLFTKANVRGAPDLIIEILSPGHEARDKATKKSLYEQHGIKEYWIVDPVLRKITVMALKEKRFEVVGVYGRGTVAKSRLLPGFQVATTTLFGSDKLSKVRSGTKKLSH